MNLDTINISKLPADVRKTYKRYQVMHAEKKIQNKAKNDFLSFVKCVWPDFIEGAHHRHVAEKFNKLARGEFKTINREHAAKAHEVRVCVLPTPLMDGGP